MLDQQKAKTMAEHLVRCEKCRKLDELAACFVAIAPQHHPRSERKAAAPCPEVETLALYFSGLLPFFKKREVEEHLSNCATCRQVLAEVIRGEFASTDDCEKIVEPAVLESLQSEWHADLAEGARRACLTTDGERAGVSVRAHGQSEWLRALKTLWQQMDLRQHRFALAATAVLVLCLMAGPKLIAWRSNHLAQVGMKRLAEHYEIRQGELRMAGDFMPAELAPRSAAPAEENPAITQPFRKSLWWSHNNPIAKHGLALLSYFNGDFPAAGQGLRELLQNSHNDAALLNDLGVVSEAAGDTALALQYFNEAVARDSTSAAAHYNLAVLLQRLGRRQEAQRIWLRYQQMHDAPAWRARARKMQEEFF